MLDRDGIKQEIVLPESDLDPLEKQARPLFHRIHSGAHYFRLF